MKTEKETRQLYVATCDTRRGWREFQALKVWNATGLSLRSNGLTMINVCRGLDWGLHGFLTKPILYNKFISSLPSDAYVILMDSDTFWSANDISLIWNRFDCARNTKQVVVSTEMSCWIGRYCTQEDINRWYKDISNTPSYSPFLNSGVIMGQIKYVNEMLTHVITFNQSYFITYKKHKFDDQYAIANYAINIDPSHIALDYHQQLAASCSIHTVTSVPDIGWPFACKARNGTIYPHCYDLTTRIARSGYFRIHDYNCIAHRVITLKTPEYTELETIATEPVIWHGNGAGKRAFLDLAHNIFNCYLNKWNMTNKEHYEQYGYD